jgi:hypothetical protein
MQAATSRSADRANFGDPRRLAFEDQFVVHLQHRTLEFGERRLEADDRILASFSLAEAFLVLNYLCAFARVCLRLRIETERPDALKKPVSRKGAKSQR